VEQHFPNIEKAILSGRPDLLLTQLIYEIRPSHLSSQYNGDNAPTATSQEILATLHMGLIGKRNSDYSVSLVKNSLRIVDDSYDIIKPGKLHKTHSCPNISEIAPLPPLASRLSHFTPPKKEEEFCRDDLSFLKI